MHGSDGALCTENLTIQELTRLHYHCVTSLTELILKLNRVETFINREENVTYSRRTFQWPYTDPLA
jgi:hypothetical protein